MQDSG